MRELLLSYSYIVWFNVPFGTLQEILGRRYWSTNSVTALKDDGESTTSGGQSHQAKEKDVSKNFFSYTVP